MSYDRPYSPYEQGFKDEVVEALGDLAPDAYAIQTEMSGSKFPFLALHGAIKTYRELNPEANPEDVFSGVTGAVKRVAHLHKIKIN